MSSWLAAFFGIVKNAGTALELEGGINFKNGLRATRNAAAGTIDVEPYGIDASAPGVVTGLPFVDPRHYGSLVSNDNGTGAANVATINAAIVAANAASVALTGPCEVLLPAGLFYIAGTIAVLSSVTLRGAGMGKTTLYMPAASYTNTVMGTFGATSTAIECAGQTDSPYTPAEHVTLCDFTVESQATDGRCLYPIRARNIERANVRRVEIFGVPTGSLISFDSVVGGEIAGCYLHDCTTAVTTYTGSAQTTAIQTDDNRINLLACKGLHIHHNHIEDITMSGDALPSANMQTDGINLGQAVNPPQHGHNIHDNYVRNVGEGVDCFSSECNIHDNTLEDCFNVGVKLIHGARRNKVHGNIITRPGLAGLYLGGSNYLNDDVTGAVEDNDLYGNTIHDVNPNGDWDGLNPAGIRIDWTAQTYTPNNNTFSKNKITGGASTMVYAIRQDGGTDNRYYDNEAEAWITAYSSVAAGTATIINAKKAFVRASVGSDEDFAVNTEELVPYNTEQLDTQSEWNATNKEYTANSHRRLRVEARIYSAAGPGDTYQLRLKKNGTTVADSVQVMPTGASATPFVVSDIVSVVPGDILKVMFEQNGGTRTVIGNATRSYITIEEVAG
jgi:hypothetical protein